MAFNHEKHHRRSIRWQEHDYLDGIYFVTICTYEKQHVFGSVWNGKMRLNKWGRVARDCWIDIPNHYAHATIDSYVIMPNHMHGIVWIGQNKHMEQYRPNDASNVLNEHRGTACHVPIGDCCNTSHTVVPNRRGTARRAPTTNDKHSESIQPTTNNGTVGCRLRNATNDPDWELWMDTITHEYQPSGRTFGKPTNGSLSTIIGSYKSAVTKRINSIRTEYGNSVWQRNYHEHIIRDADELMRIRRYIDQNPIKWTQKHRNYTSSSRSPS